MKNSEPVPLFVSPILLRSDLFLIFPEEVSHCHQLMILWERMREKPLRITFNPLAPFQGRSFVGECLCCLRVTRLPNSGSPPAIPLNKGRHNFSSLAQEWHKCRTSSLRKSAKYLKKMVGPTRLELVTSAMSRRRSSQLSYGPFIKVAGR